MKEAYDTSKTLRITTAGELLQVLEGVDPSVKVKIETNGFISFGVQLSQRRDLTEVTVTKRKIIIRGLDLEGWRPDSRAESNDD